MPSDCSGACACDCRSVHPTIQAIEDRLEKLEKENKKLLMENRQLKEKLAKLTADRGRIIDQLAKKLKDL